MTACNKRVLILVVAYNAETTIESVLTRIPVDRLPPGTEALVIDDSSVDATFETARANRDKLCELRVTVLQNPENQGYGGNQKIGYQYAIDHGFDVVALLHGDGQYAPEKLPDLIEPLLSGRADACFGSRMTQRWAPVRNGMPLYKYIGNRILTVFQNRILGTDLTEFHSGYRVYSVSALRQVPFRYNTNNFHFDTEIIIQLHMRGLRIVELPIPTYYGDEICYVNGLAYACRVVISTLLSRTHLMGILFQRKYDIVNAGAPDRAKLGYISSHTLAVSAVRPGSTVLDLKCGQGHMARELKKKNCHVTGVDKQDVEHECMEKCIAHDLNGGDLPDGLGTYDHILLLDCLEHLDAPERLLDRLRSQCYAESTSIILTVPNVGFLITRVSLLLGQFNYSRKGILDFTHKRLFTFKSCRRLLEQEGYAIHRIRGIPGPFPKALGDNALSRLLLNINRIMVAIRPQLFAYQIYVEATPRPPLQYLLTRTLESGG